MLATKVGMPVDASGLHGASRRTLIAGVEASLRRLNTDWIDLYQQHQPDPLTPIEETLRAFDDLVRQGKVRYIGCSNFRAWQVVEARWTSRTLGLASFVSCQNEYSLLGRGPDRELIPMMQATGMGLLPYYPLASGLLTGKYRRNTPMPEGARLTVHGARYGSRFINDANWPIVERLETFAEQRGRTLLELAFSWLASRDPACPASSPARRNQSSWTRTCVPRVGRSATMTCGRSTGSPRRFDLFSLRPLRSVVLRPLRSVVMAGRVSAP